MQVVADTVVDPGGRHTVRLLEGDSLSVEQVEGGQAVDLVAVGVAEPWDYLSMWMSCAVNRKWKLTASDVLVSHAGRRMFTIADDTCHENYCGGGYCSSALNAGAT